MCNAGMLFLDVVSRCNRISQLRTVNACCSWLFVQCPNKLPVVFQSHQRDIQITYPSIGSHSFRLARLFVYLMKTFLNGFLASTRHKCISRRVVFNHFLGYHLTCRNANLFLFSDDNKKKSLNIHFKTRAQVRDFSSSLKQTEHTF